MNCMYGRINKFECIIIICNYRIINEIKEKLAVYGIFHMTVQIENTGINVH